MRYHLWRRVKLAIVETGSLVSFSVTSLVQLTRMGSFDEFLDKCKSLLGIAAGLGLASPCLDQELICVVGSSVGYLLEKSARWWCQMGSLEPFVADNLMVSNGVIGAICSWHLADLPEGVCWLVTRPALGIGSHWAFRLPQQLLCAHVSRSSKQGESTRELLARPDGLGSFSSPSSRPCTCV